MSAFQKPNLTILISTGRKMILKNEFVSKKCANLRYVGFKITINLKN